MVLVLKEYLVSIFEAGGTHMPDVRARIAMAGQHFGKLRHIWTHNATNCTSTCGYVSTNLVCAVL